MKALAVSLFLLASGAAFAAATSETTVANPASLAESSSAEQTAPTKEKTKLPLKAGVTRHLHVHLDRP